VTDPASARGVLRIVFPGEPGSFAEDAAIAYFGTAADITPLASFSEAVEAVEARRVDRGVVPIENVVFGTVQQVQDLLGASDVVIVGEVIVPVRLCLAALPGQRLEEIERVYSHIQALGQSEAFLRSRPWSLLAATNTAGAGRMIADRSERGSAAVLSPRAAALFGLEVLAADIQSEPRNRTRFLVIAPPGTATPPTDPAAAMHSTLLVAVRNEPGTLVRVLSVLAAHGLNMTKLESRPSRTSAWDYVFWIDVDADLSAPEHAAALGELHAAAVNVRVLGCYTKAAEPA
jgi:prephenate dehydratase